MRGTLLAIFALAAALVSEAAAQAPASVEAQIRESLVRSTSLLEELGSLVGSADIESSSQEARIGWQDASDLAIREALDLDNDAAGSLVRIQWLEERISAVRETFGKTPRRVTRGSEESDWPVTSCVLPDSGDEPPSWQNYASAVAATEGAMEGLLVAMRNCDEIKIRTIHRDEEFNFDAIVDGDGAATCHGEVSFDLIGCEMAGGGSIRGSGIRLTGGQGIPHPGSDTACGAAALILKSLAATQEFMGMQIECWSSGTAKANYERLGVIHDEIARMQAMVDAIRKLLFENALGVRGGSRPAIAYLPAEHGGFIEESREVAASGIEATSSLGYRMRPGTQRYFSQGDSEKDKGDFKRAFDRYRKAFRLATRASMEKASPSDKRLQDGMQP